MKIPRREASAVAQAAMNTGDAQTPVDIHQYREDLERRLGNEAPK
jgi:hypothetical protein